MRLSDPFGNGENTKELVARSLQYASEDEECFKCKLRYARRGECSTDDKCRQLKAIANFISHIEWTTDWKEEGGVSWLELYIWYRMHSPKTEEDPLASTKPLMNDIATYKGRIRKVATYCIDDGEE